MGRVARAGSDDAGRLGPRMTILAWAFTIYMIQGYLLVPFDRFESADQDACEAARAEAEEIGGTHEGRTVVVDAGCSASQKARDLQAKLSAGSAQSLKSNNPRFRVYLAWQA